MCVGHPPACTPSFLACSCPAVTSSQCRVTRLSVSSHSKSGSSPDMPPSGLKGMLEMSLPMPADSTIDMHCRMNCTASRHFASAVGPDLPGRKGVSCRGWRAGGRGRGVKARPARVGERWEAVAGGVREGEVRAATARTAKQRLLHAPVGLHIVSHEGLEHLPVREYLLVVRRQLPSELGLEHLLNIVPAIHQRLPGHAEVLRRSWVRVHLQPRVQQRGRGREGHVGAGVGEGEAARAHCARVDEVVAGVVVDRDGLEAKGGQEAAEWVFLGKLLPHGHRHLRGGWGVGGGKGVSVNGGIQRKGDAP
eukprot:scaffold18135_cov116-Isochrysis_galbana.AAC.1